MYYKIINGLISLDKNLFFSFSNNLYTRGHNCKITVPVGSCKFMNNFSKELLIFGTVNAASLASFSSRLNNFNLSGHMVGRALEWSVFLPAPPHLHFYVFIV